MEKRICSNSGIELSVLGTGCWAFGGGEYWGQQSQDDADSVVRASIDMGINYFDTAEVYNEGRSEISLGKAITGIPRDKLVIGSKVSPSNCYRNTLIQHCEASLQRLGTEYIDIYMIHWPIHPHSIRHFTSDQKIINNPPSVSEAIGDLEILKNKGMIRAWGVSNFAPERIKELPADKIAVNQLPYNLLCRAIEYEILPFCYQNGIGVIGYMALLQGILADLYPTFDEIPVLHRRTRHFNSKKNVHCRHGEQGAEEETENALLEIRRICKESGLPMSEIALKWVLANKAITCSLIGSRNANELENNVKAVVSDPLDDSVKKELDRVTLPLMKKLENHFDYWESAENDRTR